MLHVLTPGPRAGRVVGASVMVAALAAALASCASSNDGDDAATGTEGAVSFTDLAGRQVELDHAPERVILGEGRSVFATGVLNKEDPLDKVVAIGSTSSKPSRTTTASWKSPFPRSTSCLKSAASPRATSAWRS